MDNLTHSMTAAVAAKFIQVDARGNTAVQSRTIFWLLVASVNFPDLDVIMAVFGDPILNIKTHRWITHSVIFVPLFAIIPAAVFYRFSSLKNFRLLWLGAMLGIFLHIVCDLVTPYGTQLLAPFSTHRFTLSSLFIIDLYFSGGLLVFLLLGRFDRQRQKLWRYAALVFAIGFLAGTFGIQKYADARLRKAAAAQGFKATKISTLPQPLSIFRWIGLVQTPTGVHRSFFPVFGEVLVFDYLPHAHDAFAARTRQTELAQWYLSFAHHPIIYSFKRGEEQVVEIHDLQFTAPLWLIQSLGLKRKTPPFTLRFTYGADGELKATSFNQQ